MKYDIAGADATTGADRRLDFEADSDEDAIRIANEHGIFPYKVSRIPEPRPQVALLPMSPLRRPTAAESVGGVIGCGVVLVIFLMCSGVFSSKSGSSSPTYRYDNSSDRELENLPSLQRYSESEKEHIISEAKKFDTAVNELERKRGY